LGRDLFYHAEPSLHCHVEPSIGGAVLFQHLIIKQQTLKRVQGDSSLGFRVTVRFGLASSGQGFVLLCWTPSSLSFWIYFRISQPSIRVYLVMLNPFFIVMPACGRQAKSSYGPPSAGRLVSRSLQNIFWTYF